MTNTTPWQQFKLAARLGKPARVPVALIVDSPWLAGYAGIDTRDYYLLPDGCPSKFCAAKQTGVRSRSRRMIPDCPEEQR